MNRLSYSLSKFRYPFTLEPHVLAMESSRQTTVAAHAARREVYLKSREDAKKRRKREALQRVAPGFDPDQGVLRPTSFSAKSTGKPTQALGTASQNEEDQQQKYLDQLVDQLSKLD